MSSESDCTDWDLGSVISLSHALSLAQTSVYQQHVSTATAAEVDKPDSTPKLGDFDRLWEYLGQPKKTPPHIQARLDRVVSIGPNACADQPEVDGGESEDETVRAEDDINGYNIVRRAKGNMQNVKGGAWTGRRTKREAREAKRLIENARDLMNTQCDDLNFHDLPGEEANEDSLFNLHNSPLRRLSTTSPSHWSPDPRASLWMASNLSRTNHWEIPASPNRISSKIPTYVFKSAADKKATLILKLHAAFEADRESLTNTITFSPRNSTNSIHIFVDFSNILWGFFDCLQTSRKTHVYSDMRRPPFSFHSLSLVMERGRPTAKKVLVGSKPLIPEFKEAEECGYQTNILERVLKDPNPRKVRQRKSGYGTSDPSSSSETNTTPPQRNREQAVDEVLHLKIMETLVDYDKPATIVLATGDAAEAEYSDGFMKMVQRALQRGWRVELVSFRACISGAYLNKRFRGKWGDRFTITELDEYAGELVGSSSGQP